MGIDLVYLWVDSNDSQWLARKNAFLGLESDNDDANCKGRFTSNDELKYALRSVEKYVPWIRKIFIVTDRQTPAWLDISHPKIQIVDIEEILPQEALPCYNSVVIECFLYRLPGLSEYFLYSNDDMFFNSDVLPDFFFAKDGFPIVRLQKKPLGKWRYRWKHLTGKSLSTYRQTIVRAAQLTEEKFGEYYSGIPHHNVDAYRKSDYQTAVENVFADEVMASVPHHLRNREDVQRATFLYYALTIKRGHLKYVTHSESSVFDVQKGNFEHYFRKYNPLLFCINDGECVTDTDRQNAKDFLGKYFSKKSSFEK
jgi:hypothetical protein